MKCPSCGAANHRRCEFCQNCGIRLPRRRPAVVLRHIGKRFLAALARIPKKILIPSAALLVLLIGLAIAIPLLLPGKYRGAESNLRLLYDTEKDETVAVFGDRALSTALKGKVLHYESSFDGTEAAVLMTDETLYYLTEKSMVCAGEAVSSFSLAEDGEGLAIRGTDGSLQLYRGGRRTAVADESGEIFCISPNGKTVAYTKPAQDGKAPAIYTFNGMKSVRQNYSGTPLAVSNGCRYLYYYRTAEEGNFLFVNDRQLSSGASVSHFALTMNARQLLFIARGEETLTLYLSADGGAAVPLTGVESGGDVPVILHRDCTYMLRSAGASQLLFSGVRTFSETFFRAGPTLYYMSRSREVEKISAVDRSYGVFVSDRCFYFVKEGTASLYRAPADDRQNASRLAEEITAYAVLGDGKAYYYTDAEQNLYYVASAPEKAQLVRREVTFLFTCGKNAVFSNRDDFLFTVRRAGSPKKLFDDIDRLTMIGNTVYYEYTRQGIRHVMAGRNGKTFTEVYAGS